MTVHAPRERPTAAQPGAPWTTESVRVPAPVQGRASAATAGRGAPGITEAMLFRGLARIAVPRSKRCACGGTIRVDDAGDEALIARAVLAHNESTRHARWRARAGEA